MSQLPRTIVYWLLDRGHVLTSILSPSLVEMACDRDKHGGKANHVVCRQWRPIGASKYRYHPEDPWIDIDGAAPFASLGQTFRLTRGERRAYPDANAQRMTHDA